MDYLTKDPGAELDYGYDWTAWLAGDTLTDSSWTLASGDVVLGDQTHDTATTTVWVSGGTASTRAVLTNRVTTAEGRSDERSRGLIIEQR